MPAWGGYANGRIPQRNPPLVLMVPGNPNSWAHPAFAHQFQRMDDACYRATGYRIGLVEVFRELGVPADARVTSESRTSTGSSNQWYQRGRWQRGLTPSAAAPGTSNHGWALAGDIAHYYIPAVWSWLLAHADEFGFSWATGKASGERWHWEYVGTLSLASLGITPLNERQIIPMSATAPIKYKSGSKTMWSRKRGDGPFAVVETTTSVSDASSWCRDLGIEKSADSLAARSATTATATLQRWAAEIAADRKTFAALSPSVVLDEPAEKIAAAVLAGINLADIFDADDAAAIADAVVDEQAARLKE